MNNPRNRCFERHVASGLDIAPTGAAKEALEAAFAAEGGKAVFVTDKGYVLEFPSLGALDRFRAVARRVNALVELPDADDDWATLEPSEPKKF